MPVDPLWKVVNIKKAVQNAGNETYTEPHFPTVFSTTLKISAFFDTDSKTTCFMAAQVAGTGVFHKNVSVKSNSKFK